MRKYVVSALLAALLLGCSDRQEAPSADARYQSIDTVPMLIMQIQKCSRLYTTEYHVHKIVTHDDELALKGSLLKQDINIKMPLGERKIAIPIDATVKAYIDFSDFSEKNVRRDGDKITLVLPDPKVTLTSSKIDQKSIRSYVGITRAHFSDEEMSHYEQQGREAILRSVGNMDIVGTARESATRLLVPMLAQLGYREQDITITFRREFRPADIRTLLDRSTVEK